MSSFINRAMNIVQFFSRSARVPLYTVFVLLVLLVIGLGILGIARAGALARCSSRRRRFYIQRFGKWQWAPGCRVPSGIRTLRNLQEIFSNPD
jgi:hypothetical protein